MQQGKNNAVKSAFRYEQLCPEVCGQSPKTEITLCREVTNKEPRTGEALCVFKGVLEQHLYD